MPKKKDSGLNRLLCSEVMKFNDDPLLGVIVMQTVDGDIVLAINKNTVEQLQTELAQFLLPSPPH